MIEPVLLTVARISTFNGQQGLTTATGFFFERDQRLFLVTSRHVLLDEFSQHFPDHIQIEVHSDIDNIARSTGFSMPLYRDNLRVWRQALDSAGEIDVAAIEIDLGALPENVVYRAFSSHHLLQRLSQVAVGTSLLVVGFPLGFHDTLHHMPVVRHAIVASSFGLRFQGKGYFLTDARMHRGSSGSPVVMAIDHPDSTLGDLPWMLLGVHSSKLDVGTRDLVLDEALDLNCTWYADILLTLTERRD